jgi:hypothetical protein
MAKCRAQFGPPAFYGPERKVGKRVLRPMKLTYDTWVALMFVLLVMVIGATFLFGLRRDE